MRRLVTALAGAGLVLAVAPPAVSAAASDTATTLFPVNDSADQLETHSWVDCKVAAAHCDFIAGVQLRTPDGVAGFPPDLWARQSTEIRSNKRSAYLDVHTAGGEGPWADRGGPGTKVFKEGGTATVTSLYNGAGPPDKYQTVGTIDSNDWATGRPATDAKVIVCANVQVVYAGVNLTTPSTCAQATFS
ncbi:hypothetical protein [Mycobacterium talmoniae]|uniref:Secreted protein n=1 Tax=Mycobacterium talmoniae TaxID=1858794 RepID=A0A1S1MYB5_9MYCO|nr:MULTISPECIES: hypothetical protein [Mycobacterium]OHU93785.1 hypothetical protein BKN37_23710 [Mycobacterium talmoniae]PQM49372.1 hypothetical protein C1Y40_00394 [Mycobacterium talmoniae]TDH51389.1 hypothetical protein E2F47_16060 [Mycobacterium eburneum]